MKTITIPRALQDWLTAPRSVAWHEANPGKDNRALPNVIGQTRYRLTLTVGPQERELILLYAAEALEDDELHEAVRGAIEHTQQVFEALEV